MNLFHQSQAAVSVPLRRNNILVMAACIAVMLVFGYQVFSSSYNFDIWYLLATGREILENGIPYENVFSMIPDAKIVVQQWLLCVIYFLIYEISGFWGIGLFVTLVFFVTMVVLYRIVRIRRRDDLGGEWIMVLLLLVMVVIQPQMKMVSTPISILILGLLVLTLELYRRDGRYRYLVFAELLVVFHMQVHMSFIVFDLGVIAAYLIPGPLAVINRKLTKSQGLERPRAADYPLQRSYPCVAFMDADCRHLPLLILLVGALTATLINPYGIDGALYLVNSYGAASYGNVIPELRPQTPFAYGMNGICALFAVILSAAAIGKNGLRHIDLPALLIFACCTYLGFAHLRNLWMLGLPLVLLGGDMMRGWYMPGAGSAKDPAGYPRWALVLSAAFCVLGISVFATLTALNHSSLDENAVNERYTPESLLNALVRDASDGEGEGTQLDELRIFNPTVLGGYMEWCRLPVYNDSRIEVWNAAISGLDRDLHNEYVDMTLGQWSTGQFAEFIDENEFDYLIAERDSPLHRYLAQDPRFKDILGTSYYELYKKQ